MLYRQRAKKAFEVQIAQKALNENELGITVSFKSLVKKPLDIPEMGVTLPLNGTYKNVRYYGLGNAESYSDFCAQDTMGIYETTAQKMYVENIKPQESGNRHGVRFAEVTDKNGHGIRIPALDSPIDFKAVDVDRENLCKAKHIEDVIRTDKTIIHINGFVRGIGSQSCGSDTAEQFKKIMHYKESFTYFFKLERI